MKAITIDNSKCTLCRVCIDVCPNKIFQLDNELITTNSERTDLCVMCGQCMAACSGLAISVPGLDYEKDFFELSESPGLEEPFNALIQSRRSIRAFKNVALPKDKLEQIVDAMSLAPHGFPPLKTEIVVIHDKNLIEESLPHMVNLYNNLLKALKNPIARQIIKWETGHERFRTITNHIVPMFTLKLPTMKNGTEDAITRNAQALILFHADKSAEDYRADIYIALAFALLKAHSLGIGATAIDLIPPAIERAPYLRQLFKIPEKNEVVASIILGYPKHKYKRGIRRELKSVTWL